MSAWIILRPEVWSSQEATGFYVGGQDNWKLVCRPSIYPANNVNGSLDGIKFTRDGRNLEAYLKDQLLVLLMVANESGHHELKSLIDGFKWDSKKWGGGTINLVDGLVKISEHSRPD